MAVSEEDIKEEEKIQEDFRKAREIFNRIKKEFPENSIVWTPHILFALCLIYVKQLKAGGEAK